MSVKRNFVHNPFFHNSIFCDPFFTGQRYHRHPSHDLWLTLNSKPTRQPAVNLSEQGDTYLVEAEVPGFKKENIDIKVGDGGRSLTVSSKQVAQSASDSTPSSINDGKSRPPPPSGGHRIEETPKLLRLSVPLGRNHQPLFELSGFRRQLIHPRCRPSWKTEF